MDPIENTLNTYQFEDRHALNPKLFLDIQPYLNTTELDKLPTPEEGNSRKSMRILDSSGVLIRIAENEEQAKHLRFRANRMMLGREVILKNNFKHLKIPKCILSGSYLIEKFLPNFCADTFTAIAYYMQNRQFFDAPVVELTKFLFKITLEDIVGNNGWMSVNWPHGVPRYDNVLIYEKTKNDETTYKIGLIDLEELYSKENTIDDLLLTAKNVILLFPYQYEKILATCQKIVSFTETQEIFLNSCKESAIESIKRVYDNHGNFLIESRMLTADPFTQFLNSPESQTQLINEMIKEISDWNNLPAKAYKISSNNIELFKKQNKFERADTAIVYLKALGENPEESLKFCITDILHPLLRCICEDMKAGIEKTKNQIPFTNSKILSGRIMIFDLIPNDTLFYNKENNTPSFAAVELTTKFDKTLVRPIYPEISDQIVKNQLETGLRFFEIQKIMFNLFKNKGFIADVFYDDKKFITVQY